MTRERLRQWAKTRAKNASETTELENLKEMPVLLTRPELELERSFELSSTKNDNQESL